MQGTSASTLASVDGLTRSFGSLRVLSVLDIDIGPGVLGILGPNGAGKTTLMRTLATVLPVQEGRVEVAGYDVADRRQVVEARRALGYLPQVFGYHGGFSAREFVEYVGWMKGLSSRSAHSEAAWALEQVDLTSWVSTKMRKLSGGMRRRVGIAQALVNRPLLLLLDEPTAGLDPEQRIAFRRLLGLLGESAAVVVSTHLVEDVATACTRVVVVADGMLRFDGSPEQLSERGSGWPEEGNSPVERGYLAAIHSDAP